MPFPDFIIGGAPKSGTTALYNYLGQHPGVFTCVPKEPNYFLNWGEVQAWGCLYTEDEYKALFDEKDDRQVAGEGSTWYLNHAERVAPRMAETIPSVRLLFLLRNPIDRAYSDYWYNLLRGHLPSRRPFSWYVDHPDHWIFNASKAYLKGLQTFYRYFERDQVCVLLTDNLKQNRDATLERACRHIGVDPDFAFESSTRHNVTRYPRYPRLLRLLGRLAPGLSRWASDVAVLRPLRSRLLFSKSATKPPMRPADRDRLAERYADAIDELSRLIDRDLSFWLDSPQ